MPPKKVSCSLVLSVTCHCLDGVPSLPGREYADRAKAATKKPASANKGSPIVSKHEHPVYCDLVRGEQRESFLPCDVPWTSPPVTTTHDTC